MQGANFVCNIFFFILAIRSLLFVSVLAVPKPDEGIFLQKVIVAEKKCLANFPPELKKLINDLKVSRTMPENPDNDFKCFLFCMGKELEVVDSAGQFHAEKLKELTGDVLNKAQVTSDEINQAVDHCIQVDHHLSCDKMHLYVDCKYDKFKHVEIHDDLLKSTQD